MARLDQGNVASVAKFAALVKEWAGSAGVHVLVNNAALGSATVKKYVEGAGEGFVKTVEDGGDRNATGSVAKMVERAKWDEALMRVNALGPLWVTNALMDLIERGAESDRAVIVFIGSVGGGSAAVFPEYCAADLMSKAAMSYLSKHLAAMHVMDGIDVCCVAPGATETEMFRKSTLDGLEDVDKFVGGMPKRRLIQPRDVAEVVVWLATECPRSLFHGAVLDASMGLAVRPGLQTESQR